MSEIRRLPLLPLRGMMIFPYMIIHFDVGRKRSVAALEKAMLGDKRIFVCAQHDANREVPGLADLYEFGTMAEVRQIFKLPGGAVRILVEGICRGRCLAVHQVAGDYDEAEVEIYADAADGSMEMMALLRKVTDKFEKWVRITHKIPTEALVSVAISDDVGRLADIMAGHLSLKLEEKQEILSILDLKTRLEKLYVYLKREMDILAIERQIDGRVKEQFEKIHKDYYLREKIKAIHAELGDNVSRDEEVNDFKQRLAGGKYPDHVKAAVEKELHRLAMMPNYSQEASVSLDYINWLLDLPWSATTPDNMDIRRAARVLAADHYGLEKVKDRILEYLAVRSLVVKRGDAVEMRAPILCLVGPPGVGKTSLAESVAKATGRKFVRGALGGTHDEAELRGHRRTYVGALPGRIIEGLKRAGTKNPVFLLDEVDKLAQDFHGNPAAALLEILDPVQSRYFVDNYIDLPFDLSEVLWIVTANSLTGIPRPLRDRLEIITLSSYTAEEKLQIARRFLLARELKANGLTNKELAIGVPVLRRLINEYTREAGVRELQRTIGRLCRKVARQIVEDDAGELQLPVRIKPNQLEKYLDRPKFGRTKADHKPEIGVVTGMAWTEVGGDILPTEAAVLPGKGRLTLTGQLGDVMKESAQAGLSYIRRRYKELRLAKDFYEKIDIHIHLPEGAIPKDGPSAGITMAVAVISALTKRRVRSDVAMTGEITLRGRVLAIGGLKEKVLAAHREGMKTIIIPFDNRRDVEDIPASVRDELEFVPVETMDEILEHVWED